MYRDALGVPPPGGLPESFLEDIPDAMDALVRRYARTHGPFPTAQLHRRYGVDPTPALRELERSGTLVRGELLPGGTEREWCDADVLRRVRRASLAHLRKEAEAVDTGELARFIPSWQNVDAHRPAGAGPDRLREALVVAAGGRADARRSGSATCCPAALAPTARAWLDELTTGGEVVWIGAGPLGRTGPRRPLLPRGRPACRPAAGERQARSAGGRGARRDPRAAGSRRLLLARPRRRAGARPRGASRGAVGPCLGRRGNQRRLRAPARAPPLGGAAPQSGARRFATRRAGANRAVQGRWSLTAPLFGEPRPRARGCAPRPS